MYLSYLMINTGANPDRPRPGRLWLRNLYRVHQRLCMAFPSSSPRREDPDFLSPFQPNVFAQKEVHVPRNQNAGFLYRVDPKPGGDAVIIVLSARQPDWDYAFHNAQYLLNAPPPPPRTYRLTVADRDRCRFRLLANTVRRLSRASKDPEGQTISERWLGKRVPVPATPGALSSWLETRAESSGFRVIAQHSIQPGFVYVNRTGKKGQGVQLRSARFDGELEVTNASALKKAIASGIGPAKAFGFGLLSVAPVQ